MKNDTQLARWLSEEMDEHELEALKKSPEYPTLVQIRDNFTRLQRPQFDSERILEKVLIQEKIGKRVTPIYRATWFQTAAIIIVLLGLAIMFLNPEKQLVSEQQTLAFTLPDNSEVVLNTDSKAAYSKWNWADNRLITLDGEAYFKVAKGKTFRVKTNSGTVTVVGTKFNVNVRADHFDVICYEGKVRVQKGATDIILIPNQHISFIEDASPEMEAITESAPEWLYPEMTFSQEEFSSVISKIEKQYSVKINVTLQSGQLFTGSLPSNDLQAALKMLCGTFHLKIVESANDITLVPVDAKP